MMHPLKRYAVVLLIGMFLIPITAYGQDEVQILDEYEVVPDSFSESVTATGAIEPARSVGMSFEFSAPVEEIFVQEGDSVRAGDMLAQLDADDLSAALREAEIALELQQLAFQALVEPPREVDIAAAEAAVTAAEAGIPAAGFGPTREQIRIAELQADLARNQLWQTQLQRDIHFQIGPEFRGGRPADIQQQSAVSQAEFETTIADTNIEATIRSGGGAGAIANAEAQLVRAQVALDNLLNGPDDVEMLRFEIQLDQAELAVEQAQVALNRTQLFAPFDGIVSQNNLTQGQIPPQAPQPAMQIVDSSFFYVELGIDESDVVDINLGQTVTLRLDALPETQVTGEITRISILPLANANTVIYQARVRLNPTEANIRVGMSTTATITTQELEDVLVVPNKFIQIDPDTQQASVTIQTGDDTFEQLPVELGARNATSSVIVDGVEPGQRVVQIPRGTLGLEDVFGGPPGG